MELNAMATPAWARRVTAVAAPLVVLALGVWVISPRFSISGPSLIDDWDALLSAPAAMHALVHFSYHVQDRYFPAWILWNWAQWRVPGAPGNMLGPNLLGVARLALLVAGVTSLSWILVPRLRRHPVEHAFLCSLPALVVVTVPAFGPDLARFGPNEPALAGGMMLGGSLLYWGGRDLGAAPSRAPLRAVLLVVVGYLAWCYGVLTKETSVCALILLALAIPLGRGVVRRLSRRQIAVGAVLVGAALLPLLLMLYEVARIVQHHTLPYGAHVDSGGGAISELVTALRAMQHELDSVAGLVTLVVVVAATVVSAWRRRFDWVQLSILVVAVASLAMSVQTGYHESRYYMPTIALLSIGAARAIGALPLAYVRAIVVAAFVLAFVSAIPAHSKTRYWAAGDQLGDDLVSVVRVDTRGGCGLSISGVDYERTRSIAALVAYPKGRLGCVGMPRSVLLGPAAAQSPAAACAPARPTTVGSWNVSNDEEIQFVRCGRS
jgi:hypothetical protein